MPLRSPKMNLFIFGFQRRVWWPKWTPASSSCFIVTTATRFSSRRLSWSRHRVPEDDRGHAETYVEKDPDGPHRHASGRRGTSTTPAGGRSPATRELDAMKKTPDSCCLRARPAPGPPRSGQLVAQPLPQMEDRLGVDLAGAALGHPEYLAYLGEVETFVVVQRENLALPVVQPLDRLRELAPGLFELDRRPGRVSLVLERVAQGLAATAPLAEQDVVEL